MQSRSFFCGFKCCQIHLTPCFQRSKTVLIDRKRKSDYSQGRSREQITYKGGYFMELNAQIKKYRRSLNLSQEELAEKVYVTRQTISNWRNRFQRFSARLNGGNICRRNARRSIYHRSFIRKAIDIMFATLSSINVIDCFL